MLSEITYPNMLCPNITSFKVNGDILTNNYLELSVDIKKGANNAQVMRSIFYMSEITRYFDP